jgi:hypothetical protein
VSPVFHLGDENLKTKVKGKVEPVIVYEAIVFIP